MDFVEAMAIEVSRAVAPDRPIQDVPFPRFTFDEAIERFGSDKPDMRFGDGAGRPRARARGRIGGQAAPSRGSASSTTTLAAGGRVKAIVAPGMAGATRREIDELTELARRYGAKGLVHLAVDADGASPLADRQVPRRGTAASARRRRRRGAGRPHARSSPTRPEVTADVLGRLRRELGDRLGLADPNVLAYCWVHRFPMYQWDAENSRWDATHNPFSGVVPEDEPLLVTASGDPYRPAPDDPGRPRARAAVRHRAQRLGARRRLDPDPSPRAAGAQLRAAGPLARAHARPSSAAILEAFEFGAPPHGGIALGIDRWAALISDQTNIREVMAFPKTASGTDLMLEAPSAPDPDQYAELGLALRRRRRGSAGCRRPGTRCRGPGTRCRRPRAGTARPRHTRRVAALWTG